MREKIVIIGGGFAGLQLARHLNNNPKYKVMVIDRMNHHMFQPLFYQVATGRIEPSNISFPFRKIFQKSKNIQFRMTEIEKIIPSENKIIGKDGVFTYDKLVIATGCRTNFFGNQKMQELTLGMKNTQEAITIRNHILMTFEKMIIERKASDDGNWNLVIVGSGPTGVELAGAFSEMKTYIMPRDYPRMNFSDLNIILISSGDKPLEAMSQESQDAAEKYLIQLGVKFLKNERVTDYDGDKIYMQSGNSIPTNNVIWAAGVTGNIIDDFNKENLVRNRYIVNRYNQVKGYDNILPSGGR